MTGDNDDGDEEKEDAEEISASGYKAQLMPEQVKRWKRRVVEICENYEEMFKKTIQIMGGGDENREKCKAMVSKFGNRVSEMLDDKFGSWLHAPLCLAEMLVPGEAHNVASDLCAKYTNEDGDVSQPSGINTSLWEAVLCFSKKEHGDEMEDYTIILHDDRTVDLHTYVEAMFLSVCIHNADPERSFSILNHYLKRAPNARLHALSAYLRMKLNPSTVTVEQYSKEKKKAVSELFDTSRNGKRGMYKRATCKPMHAGALMCVNCTRCSVNCIKCKLF
jgi:hypothetical protein